MNNFPCPFLFDHPPLSPPLPSMHQLGYVDLNLAEYAGAKDCQRRYLLTSYNDNKRRPDNSILKVSITTLPGGPPCVYFVCALLYMYVYMYGMPE